MRVQVVVVAAVALAAGAWQRLPASPLPASTTDAVSVWTGTRMLVFGRAHRDPPWSRDVAAAYDPASRTWRRLSPLAGPKGNYEGRYHAVWTGREMLVFGPFDFQAFDPRTGRWRRPPAERGGGAGGLVVWTGRELIDWGGGCCGDASAGGSAYDPATNRWRGLARSPLAPSQRPVGTWDGRELVVVVSGLDPDGKAYPARLARAAAYNPTTDTWRRIAPAPARRDGAVAVWDGSEMLVVGGARAGLAYNPVTNRWRRLPPLASARTGFAAVWSGRQLLVWGGTAARGAAYDPQANRWSQLPAAPVRSRLEPAAVWTGSAMVVWGGHGSGRWPNGRTDGARYTP